MSEFKITIKDIEELKAHVSAAVVRDIQEKVSPLLGEIKTALAKVPVIEADVLKLKNNQAKALAAWTLMIGLLTTGVALLFGQIKSWVSSHFHS